MHVSNGPLQVERYFRVKRSIELNSAVDVLLCLQVINLKSLIFAALCFGLKPFLCAIIGPFINDLAKKKCILQKSFFKLKTYHYTTFGKSVIIAHYLTIILP